MVGKPNVARITKYKKVDSLISLYEPNEALVKN